MRLRFMNGAGEPTTLVVFGDQALWMDRDAGTWAIVDGDGQPIRGGTLEEVAPPASGAVCNRFVPLAEDPSRTGPCVREPGHDGDCDTIPALAEARG